MKRKNSLSDKMHRFQTVPVREDEEKTKRIVNREKRVSYPVTDTIEEETDPPFQDEEESQLVRERRRERKERRWQVVKRVLQGVLSLACIYTAFLIYCTAVTTFTYDESGKVIPWRMTKEELEERSEYRKLYYFYETSRSVYEQILLLDYRLSAGEEDPYLIAPEYEELLDTVDVLCIKTDAFHPDPGYGQVKNMLLSWQKDDIAVYLQNISSAISLNDAKAGENALQDKERVYQDFSYITQMMVSFSKTIKGMDVKELDSWSPENYIYETINGVQHE